MSNTSAVYVEPKAPETVCIIMRRREFNSFLISIHDCSDDRWKAAQLELLDDAVASHKFDRIEFFTDTMIGPIVGQREKVTENVHVTVARPTVGIYRTADAILAALKSGDIQRKN
ncbi:hypothetical protein [Sulfitobacter geojensis]|uniref:Uncharacterized protein n=1 Tax=Sulfitobacter geojensis TaxID=1342299 RepID=A0AAE3B688_9RHOB|nr:hypothetical protein [Sulfitobacter geojensis]MBM1688820.1 hypothetical protein [Sulfitobacter geojensis]MBM1692887.1 hypothetical protein [Sulfitobacter geojensis]MBM1705053.1 hypothetical protein [Sulfitobacter geojensis]MBM1709111.1 hypothetical protein [Sulfitobacter geojensis]MBM1713176.1 hypothetical protein [Sulfitobacter geojensis]